MSGANGVHDDIPIAIALAVEASGVIEPRGDIALVSLGGKERKYSTRQNYALRRRVLI